MKILVEKGNVEIEISFPAKNQVAVRAKQNGELLGFEIISDVEASYLFMNDLAPFATPTNNLKEGK